jgi:hypothetical protein
MLGHSLSIMFSNFLITFATAFALSAAPAWAQASRRIPPLMRPMMRPKMFAKVTISSVQTEPAELSENPQEKLAADLDPAHPG